MMCAFGILSAVYRAQRTGQGQFVDVAMVDSVLARYADRSAADLSALSHEDTPWAVAEVGKDIEYDHVFYRPEKLSVRHYEEL